MCTAQSSHSWGDRAAPGEAPGQQQEVATEPRGRAVGVLRILRCTERHRKDMATPERRRSQVGRQELVAGQGEGRLCWRGLGHHCGGMAFSMGVLGSHGRLLRGSWEHSCPSGWFNWQWHREWIGK